MSRPLSEIAQEPEYQQSALGLRLLFDRMNLAYKADCLKQDAGGFVINKNGCVVHRLKADYSGYQRAVEKVEAARNHHAHVMKWLAPIEMRNR